MWKLYVENGDGTSVLSEKINNRFRSQNSKIKKGSPWATDRHCLKVVMSFHGFAAAKKFFHNFPTLLLRNHYMLSLYYYTKTFIKEIAFPTLPKQNTQQYSKPPLLDHSPQKGAPETQILHRTYTNAQ